MNDEEQWVNAIRDNSSETIASIILADIERIEKEEQEIKRLKRRLEEYQEYVEINHKEIERLNNIIKEQGLEDKPNYYVKCLEGSLKEYQDEVKRLNNIINELEKGIKENIEELEEHQLSRDRIDEDKEILRFLQELKGDDKE